jgi:hypothetical protein
MNTKIKFLIKCIVAVGLVFLLNFCFSGDFNAIARVTLSEVQEDGFIDVLFLGASHTQRGYDVSLIEENTGLNVFNCGSGGQTTQGSYYLLRHVNENNGVKKVWLDVTYSVVNVKEPGVSQTYEITDYLNDNKLKYEYLFTSFGVEGIVNDILPCLHNSNVSVKALKAHITGDYLKEPYKYLIDDELRYEGQGFVYHNYVMKPQFVFGDAVYIDSDNLISDYAMGYLNKIIEYCNDNDIELVLVNPPVTDVALVESGYYQEFIDCVNDVAEANGLEYWDFSLTKKEALTLSMSDYKNYNHLNGHGAEKFSECVSKVLNGELDESAFYGTFAEKLANNPDGTAE